MVGSSGMMVPSPWLDPHNGRPLQQPPMTPNIALGIPAVNKAAQLIIGLARQASLERYRGIDPLERPRLLDAPDPDMSRSLFVGLSVEDYLMNGNAVCLITARDPWTGWPTAVTWIPAAWVTVSWTPPLRASRQYWIAGVSQDSADIVHVTRGLDRSYPVRGIGVVEQFTSELTRVKGESDYQGAVLDSAAVPSAAITVGSPRFGQAEADAAKEKWMETFSGPRREPVFLPQGTTVTPLAWSPEDQQLVQARQLSLKDVANMFAIDSYHLGAEASSHTYRSPGPIYLDLLRMTVEPILQDFELAWSSAWLPRGQMVRFDRSQLTRDDFQTSVNTVSAALNGGIITREEARLYLGMAPHVEGEFVTSTSPVDTTTDEIESDPQHSDSAHNDMAGVG